MNTTSEEQIIAIMQPLKDAEQPQFLESVKAPLEERMMLAAFVDAGLVHGVYRRDEMGRPSDFANLMISVSGTKYLAEVRKKAADRTSIGYIRNRAPTIAAWFFGILSAFLGTWLAKIYLAS